MVVATDKAQGESAEEDAEENTEGNKGENTEDATQDTLDLSPCSTSLFEVSLAANEEDIAAAQDLRYRVFYEEMSAEPTAEAARCRREVDPYDTQAEHILIREREHGTLIACYRLMHRARLPAGAQFYSESEFDLSRLLSHPLAAHSLELSRACVAKNFRTMRVPALLFSAIGHYVKHHNIRMLFGCGSLPGTDPDALAMPLSWVWHHHLAPEPLRGKALEHLYEPMNRVEKDDLTAGEALRFMPPLIKGYLRMGCFVGDGAVVDQRFKTTDILLVLPISDDSIDRRYYRHYVLKNTPHNATPHNAIPRKVTPAQT